MKRLFIHNPLFRLFSPVFSGIVIYLLILLINNNVEQLQEQFLGEELYICIGLSLIIQEFSRLLLLAFRTLLKKVNSVLGLIIQLFGSMILCIVLVTVSISLYFENVLGFSPNSDELWLFNSIFCAITLIYILLHISHEYLYKVNSTKLHNEIVRKRMIEDEFIRFKSGINPNLLFDSFEALIVLIRQKSDKVDELIDHLASIYRYNLSRKERQLVSFEEELSVLDHLASLINYLPFRKIAIRKTIKSEFLFVPASLLKLVEHIVRTSISSFGEPITIELLENEEQLIIQYVHNDAIDHPFNINDIEDFHHVYDIYSEMKIKVEENKLRRSIHIPKLLVDPLLKT